ncbi:MAG TPA: hypothetical protein DC014_03795 [Treponema sp.]|jgi:hypothetical protein|nr:hypothetical protein [Treponema sp.]
MKVLVKVSVFLLVFVLCSCSKKAVEVPQVGEPVALQSVEVSPSVKELPAVDIDLTRMNANMVYAEVFNMLIEPDYYEGKSVRMNGLMYIPEQIEGSPRYACIVQDATACCSAGLGFSFANESDLPSIPKDGDFITVRGTYTCIEEDGFSTIVLVDCILES